MATRDDQRPALVGGHRANENETAFRALPGNGNSDRAKPRFLPPSVRVMSQEIGRHILAQVRTESS